MTEDHCALVEIKQRIPGFDRFIGSWIYQGEINFVVDVGPANSVNNLIQALLHMNMARVDYVLLTHIHIDHAGGLGQFLQHFPTARVVCHDKTVRHLVDPSRLWKGSRMVLGEIAEAFGSPKAVKGELCIPHTQADIKGLVVIESPGHAPHHLSFSYAGNLFAGEAGGNYYSFQDMDYLRPATPPRCFLNVFLRSVDKLMALDDQHMRYAHFGDAPNSHQMLKRFRAQILRWKEIVQKEMSTGSYNLVARCMDRLLEQDPDLKAFEFMDPDTQNRERFFMANSVRGYIEFLQNEG
ncbi:MAG: MBL fold metallo-hydrolase [Desulfobacterales bacterium]|nr:MAG: MBL fold metallo-hydrolase [Desulfobacterales bacterium]